MKWLPSAPQVTSEMLAVIAGTIGAAIIISRVPALRDLVQQNSISLSIGQPMQQNLPGPSS